MFFLVFFGFIYFELLQIYCQGITVGGVFLIWWKIDWSYWYQLFKFSFGYKSTWNLGMFFPLLKNAPRLEPLFETPIHNLNCSQSMRVAMNTCWVSLGCWSLRKCPFISFLLQLIGYHDCLISSQNFILVLNEACDSLL